MSLPKISSSLKPNFQTLDTFCRNQLRMMLIKNKGKYIEEKKPAISKEK